MSNYLTSLASKWCTGGVAWCLLMALLAQHNSVALWGWSAFSTGFALGLICFAALTLSFALLAGSMLLIGNEVYKLKESYRHELEQGA